MNVFIATFYFSVSAFYRLITRGYCLWRGEVFSKAHHVPGLHQGNIFAVIVEEVGIDIGYPGKTDFEIETMQNNPQCPAPVEGKDIFCPVVFASVEDASHGTDCEEKIVLMNYFNLKIHLGGKHPGFVNIIPGGVFFIVKGFEDVEKAERALEAEMVDVKGDMAV